MLSQLVLAEGDAELQDSLLGQLADLGTFVASVAIVIGVILALRQLTFMGQALRFQSTQEFYRLLTETQRDRRVVYERMPLHEFRLEDLDEEVGRSAENNINFLNKVAFMLRQDIVPRALIFRMGHTLFIRLGFLLEPFCSAMERELGHRWGRRAIELAVRAKRFHYINPRFRRSPVLISRGGGEVIIAFRPKEYSKAGGWFMDRWLNLLWRLKIY